jgi:3-deoxy-manno-octulosonate cytidylyltransferase (CMP-KDO synthetase)
MLYSEITGDIIGAAMEVHKQLGRGFQEYIYQRALEKELHKKNLSVKVEQEMPVYYKNEQIGLRKVDFLVNDLVCVEIKAVSTLEDVHLAQSINYLETSGKGVGLLLNFGGPSLQFKRLQLRDKKTASPDNPLNNPKNRGSIIAMIPARYAATRFPAKLMQLLGDKTVIRHTYDATVATRLFDEVFVVTDSDIIYNEIISHGGKALKSKKTHESGSDRIAEAIADMDVDVIINVQGDEPFIKKEPLEKLVRLFDDPSVQVGSLMRKIEDSNELTKSSSVKVVVNKNNDALYFSRSVIPFAANTNIDVPYFLHIGVYGFRKDTLLNFTQWPAAKLEQVEKLEQLRYLENGVSIRMALVDFQSVAIDTPEDLERAVQLL